ncbi:tetratricopeptide repeat protein [Listeria ivanovii]|uniref:Tetratrico peptide repeat group 5 domain-containing protein n=1 Tax=Listeria ivanovii (strain ATCC BAA-678 / PAM 55) TaxID=881621 RepID=G2ZE31_LISIP|nr:tetratricopeptide repeat protein [Listeria ivanovii]MBK3913237.1 tetratricopeptide repeat protein [Listeria ivanovii subsp. ivanovii]MBK3920646.1 tetratricopeptide repeat protein [Listeria ivanovii subsp. ivanovii]MBK3925528.1 tetratricopeptide repeat protein [Listeria ivanovii subsp. ivanovii]MCJ1716293.1 tetratricopeptide repeat protein [Listeria ivanovii]MCJ1721797.1 tetratricopeptide repeat protein [Listeria ivanovii]
MILTLLQNGDYETARTKSLLELKTDPENAKLNYFAAWSHDALGKEDEAIPFYEKALQNGLPDEDRKEAYIGLGSTYRITGAPEKAAVLFQKALQEFPNNNALRTFSIMTKFSQGCGKEALEDALILLTETTEDKDIISYKKAIQFYAQDLGATFH